MSLWPFGRKNKKSARVFVLGLDGVPMSLMERFMAQGRMPKLARLLNGRRLRRMNSCYPTVSNVAWSCFQTGLNPGGFGIFGFAELTPDMVLRVPTSQDLKAWTIWELLSEADKRVIGLGVPTTHPPRQVNGILVGCFLAPKLDATVHPARLLPKLHEWGYRLDIDPMRARESVDYLKGDLLRCLAGRERTISELLWSEPWDLFVAHVMETDRINHFMWRWLREPESENGKFFLDFYEQVDNLIGTVAERVDEDMELMILSDHGFCETIREVQMNRWLQDRGYLEYEGEPEGFRSLCGRTQAVALAPGRIHIMSKDRWARGQVEPADCAALRERIMAELRELKDPETGAPICRDVFKREQVFNGAFAANGPDIIVHPHDGYDLKANIGVTPLFTQSPINGMHTREDAMLFLRGRDLAERTPKIEDMMPTLLALFGIEAPAGLDGRSVLAGSPG